MSGLPYRTFAIYNAAGGTLWAGGFVLLGYLAGRGYRRVEHFAGRASLLLLLLAVTVGVVILGSRWLARREERIRAFVERQLDRPFVSRVRTRYRRQLDFLAARLRPEGALGLSLTIGFVLVVAAGWVFGVVLQDIIARDDLAGFDVPVEQFFLRHREPWLNNATKFASTFGATKFIVPFILVAGVVWWVRRRSLRPLALFFGADGGGALLYNVIKLLVGRPRPPIHDALVRVSGTSFPSGHATQAVAVYGMMAVLLAGPGSSWRRRVTLRAGAGLIALIVGISRVYLGVHWLTDVVGGWVLGGLWLSILLTTVRTIGALRGETGSNGSQQSARATKETA
jgi:undecaprenyl-diphosphatase